MEACQGSGNVVRKLKLLVIDTTFVKGKPHTRSVYLEKPIHKVVTLIRVGYIYLKYIEVKSTTIKFEVYMSATVSC